MTFAHSDIALRIGAAVAISLVMFASMDSAPACAQDYAAIIAEADRTEADRVTDKRRDPVNLLALTGPKAGWTVLDMGAGAGYSTELMARSVGPSGKVYGQVEEESDKLRSRMTRPVMTNVSVLVRPSDDPVPSDLHDLDLIPYHLLLRLS
jgi:predicted methyltransferase